VPFFGKYSKTGVVDNKVDPSTYQKNPDGAQNLETGKDGKGTGNGSSQYPNDQYQSPPQQAPATTTPQTGTGGGTGTGNGTVDPTGAAGTGTPAAPTGAGGGTGAPPP
jgi:penicillin-binding protein 1A